MLASPSHKLSFVAFTLDTVRCVLLRGEIELSLRRQSFEVLRYLAEHAGKAHFRVGSRAAVEGRAA
jgi:DNA-binding response OmpR family regulator